MIKLKNLPPKFQKQIEEDIKRQLTDFYNKDKVSNTRNSLSELLDELIEKHAPIKTR